MVNADITVVRLGEGTVTVFGEQKIRNWYGSLLAEIRTRLAEIAAQHSSEELDSLVVWSERDRRLTYREAEAEAKEYEFEHAQPRQWTMATSFETYCLKNDIESLASYLDCPTCLEIARQDEEARKAKAARGPRKPVVRYKKQRRFEIPEALAA